LRRPVTAVTSSAEHGASRAAEDAGMRTEIENAVSEIKQGITLLRRHL
jgi:hypothetical protein